MRREASRRFLSMTLGKGLAQMRTLSKPLALLPLMLVGTVLATSLPTIAQGVPKPGVQKPNGNPSKKKPVAVARKGRETQVIDGPWRFLTDPQHRGEQESWPNALPAETKETVVPALWTTQAAPGYSGVAWFWREFEMPPSWKKQTVRLRFEAVAEMASVWINGVKVGDHEGGATPFEFNVTKRLHFGEKNLVAVRVEGEAKRGAGIWQGVMLVAHDEAYLSEVALTAGGLGQLATAITLENTSDVSGVATLEGRVVAVNKPDKDVHRSEQSLSLTPGRNVTTLLTSLRGKNLHPWTPETPSLYALQLVFSQGIDVLDTQQTVFGFRQFGWKDGAITLNGSPISVKSLAPTFALPIVIASTEDVDRARASFQRLKEAGVSLLYLDAPHPELLSIADELGILVVESPRTGQTSQATFDELQALLVRDRSHPCILAWRVRAADAGQLSLLRARDASRFLLVGSSGQEKLFLPGEADSPPVAAPAGFLPTP